MTSTSLDTPSSTISGEDGCVDEQEPLKLVFNTEGPHHSFQADSRAIHRQDRDAFNRLHSIAEDAEFVTHVASRCQPIPVIANLRCGAWYVNPKNKGPSQVAYFKSTDGHDGQWQFSLRRSNLQLLDTIVSCNGIILVDSTRRGKRFPDALSKTVPSWCAVLNCARAKLLDRYPPPEFQSAWGPHLSSLGLSTPVEAVRKSENDQIQGLVDAWADQLLASSFNIESLLVQLKRPLRPIWISPASDLNELAFADGNKLEFYPVICLSASKYLGDHAGLDRARGFTYIQGAGDDHEGWSKGLTPQLFWDHRLELLSASRTELPSLIDQVVGLSKNKTTSDADSLETFEIRNTKLFISVAKIVPQNLPSRDELYVTISCGDCVKLNYPDDTPDQTVAVGNDFRTMKNLSKILASVVPNCVERMQANRKVWLIATGPNLDESKGLLVAIALCLLVTVFDEQSLRHQKPHRPIEKSNIRDKLHWIIEASKGTINPPRSILKRVNNFLIG